MAFGWKSAIPPWALGLLVTAIPVATYTWMIYTRPDVYSQIADEIRRQEEVEKARHIAPSPSK